MSTKDVMAIDVSLGEMRNRGYVINHKTVQRLMTEMHIKCKMRKVRYRSYKGEVGSLAPNIIGA